MLILISDAFDASLESKLKVFGDVTTDKAKAPEADVILVRAKTICNKEYIDAAKNCKLIIRGGVGIDNIDKPYAESKGIIVRNTPKSSAIAVAEPDSGSRTAREPSFTERLWDFSESETSPARLQSAQRHSAWKL